MKLGWTIFVIHDNSCQVGKTILEPIQWPQMSTKSWVPIVGPHTLHAQLLKKMEIDMRR